MTELKDVRENKKAIADKLLLTLPKMRTNYGQYREEKRQCRHLVVSVIHGSNKCRGCGIVWDVYGPKPEPHKYTVKLPLAPLIAKAVKVGVL